MKTTVTSTLPVVPLLVMDVIVGAPGTADAGEDPVTIKDEIRASARRMRSAIGWFRLLLKSRSKSAN